MVKQKIILICSRHVWDSYIDNKYGSSIPIGWIVPNSEVNEQWQPYLAPLNISLL